MPEGCTIGLWVNVWEAGATTHTNKAHDEPALAGSSEGGQLSRQPDERASATGRPISQDVSLLFGMSETSITFYKRILNPVYSRTREYDCARL
jgi:hypothetical protein